MVKLNSALNFPAAYLQEIEISSAAALDGLGHHNNHACTISTKQPTNSGKHQIDFHGAWTEHNITIIHHRLTIGPWHASI